MSKKSKMCCEFCHKIFLRYKSGYKGKNIYCSPICYYEYKKVSGTIDCGKILKCLNDNDFLNWFSGFWEGEGSVIITDVKRNKQTPNFTLYQSDLPVIKYIQRKFHNIANITKQTNNSNPLSKKDGYSYHTGKFGECVFFAYILKNRLKSKYKKEKLNKRIKKFKIK